MWLPWRESEVEALVREPPPRPELGLALVLGQMEGPAPESGLGPVRKVAAAEPEHSPPAAAEEEPEPAQEAAAEAQTKPRSKKKKKSWKQRTQTRPPEDAGWDGPVGADAGSADRQRIASRLRSRPCEGSASDAEACGAASSGSGTASWSTAEAGPWWLLVLDCGRSDASE